MFCPNLMTFYPKRRHYTLAQGIVTIKTFTEYKVLPTTNNFTIGYNKQCQMLRSLRQSKKQLLTYVIA